MNPEIQITEDKGYLKVQVHGRDSREASLEILRRIVAACDEHNCLYVLVKAHIINKTGVMDNYDMPQIIEEAGVTRKHRIAWVDPNPETYNISYFAETVLHNRGYINVRLFRTVADGKGWLRDEITAHERRVESTEKTIS